MASQTRGITSLSAQQSAVTRREMSELNWRSPRRAALARLEIRPGARARGRLARGSGGRALRPTMLPSDALAAPSFVAP
jgi:hypothetical protein